MNKRVIKVLGDIDISDQLTKKTKLRLNKIIDVQQECFKTRKQKITSTETTYSKVMTTNASGRYTLCHQFSDGMQGKVWVICDTENDNRKVAVLKKIRYDLLQQQEFDIIKSETLTEIVISAMTNMLFENNIIPNVVYRSKLYFCQECNNDIQEEVSDDRVNQFSKKCVYMLQELVNGESIKNSKGFIGCLTTIMNVLFQILVTLYACQKYFGIVHNDLHLNNVMLHNTGQNNRNDYIEYIVDYRKYYIPANLIVKIIDFGRGRIENGLEPEVIINGQDIYKVPIFGTPQEKVDQRRVGIFLLNAIVQKDIISRSSNKDQINRPGYYYDPVTNEVFENETQFNAFVRYKFQILKNTYFAYNQVLEVLEKMLLGQDLPDIIESSFSNFSIKEPLFNTVDSYNLDKQAQDLQITNTVIFDKYTNPISKNKTSRTTFKQSSQRLLPTPTSPNFATLSLKKNNTIKRKPREQKEPRAPKFDITNWGKN